MIAKNQIEDLHDRLVENGLDADGQRELTLLLEIPEGRQYFARLMRIDGLLSEALRAPTLQDGDTSSHWSLVRSSHWLALAAALLLIVIGAAFWWRPSPEAMSPQATAPPERLAQATDDHRDQEPRDGFTEGPRSLRLSDGSRLTTSRGAKWSLTQGSGGPRLRPVTGTFRLSGATTALSIEGPGGRWSTTDAYLVARIEDGTATIQVQRGVVRIESAAGRAAPLGTDGAWRIDQSGTITATAALEWQAQLPEDALRDPASWHGTPVGNGLALTYDSPTSLEFSFDTWNVTATAADGAGLASFHPDARLIVDLTLPKPTSIGVNVQLWAGDSDRWIAAIERKLQLPAGAARLDMRLADLSLIEGEAGSLRGSVVRRITVMGWAPDAAVVQALGIVAADDTGDPGP